MTTRILLVDDEDGLRVTLAANLELEGFEVVEAINGANALELLSKQPFDLLLTDIRMPGINGVDLFRKVRSDHPHMPVVLMTAYALEALVDDALGEGVFTIMNKPFDVSGAVATLLRAAKRPTVLVVDDQQVDAEATARALEAVGVRASVVLDGASALTALKGGGFDVCVMDLVMPGMSGSDLARQIKDGGIDVSIIAVSGFSVAELMQKVAAAGAVTVMKKPVPPRELVKTIAKARGRAGRRR